MFAILETEEVEVLTKIKFDIILIYLKIPTL